MLFYFSLSISFVISLISLFFFMVISLLIFLHKVTFKFVSQLHLGVCFSFLLAYYMTLKLQTYYLILSLVFMTTSTKIFKCIQQSLDILINYNLVQPFSILHPFIYWFQFSLTLKC